jgi:antitoxin PrlF
LQSSQNDKIRYTIQPNSQVILSPAELQENDPMVGEFLSFLAQDIAKNPQHIQAIDSDLVYRAQSLIADIKFDINVPLSDEDE